MKAPLSYFNDQALAQLGAEAVRLVTSGNLRSLQERFGYSLAFNRVPLSALDEDLAAVLSEVGASGFGDPSQSTVKVSHPRPSEAGLISLVECVVPVNNGRQVLVELVLTAKGSEGYLTLEQVSAAT